VQEGIDYEINGILNRKQRYATYLKNAANFLVA
jgi:hypothetical protein